MLAHCIVSGSAPTLIPPPWNVAQSSGWVFFKSAQMSDQIKMTIGVPEEMEATLSRLVEADGTTKTEYVRNLIETDLRKREEHYRALTNVFGQREPEFKRGQERAHDE